MTRAPAPALALAAFVFLLPLALAGPVETRHEEGAEGVECGDAPRAQEERERHGLVLQPTANHGLFVGYRCAHHEQYDDWGYGVWYDGAFGDDEMVLVLGWHERADSGLGACGASTWGGRGFGSSRCQVEPYSTPVIFDRLP